MFGRFVLPDGFALPIVVVQIIVVLMAISGLIESARGVRERASSIFNLLLWIVVGVIGVILPVFLKTDYVEVKFYGLILMSGALAGAGLAAWEVQRRGGNPQEVWDLLIYLIIGGVVGARLWHVFTPSTSAVSSGITTSYYLQNPWEILNLRHGGLGMPGVIVGGVIALAIYARKRGQRFAFWADIAAPAVALGQAIGRWGNFFNQELYGAPTDLPWKLYISPEHRLTGFENYEYYHPLFLYESLFNLANMFFLLWLLRRKQDKLLPGDVFLIYLITYPTARFFLEFLRLDIVTAAGLNLNQMVMGLVALGAAATLFWRHRSCKMRA
ncbi:MAG: prolipoprotein diacylglyceryl transferase [Anaerolineales bacterium]